jgi:hypothetical protein
MERPGFNPQALARWPGCQRLGANKNKKKAAQIARRRGDAVVRGDHDVVRDSHVTSVR